MASSKLSRARHQVHGCSCLFVPASEEGLRRGAAAAKSAASAPGMAMCAMLIWPGVPRHSTLGMAAIIQQKLLTIMAHQPYNMPGIKGWGRLW